MEGRSGPGLPDCTATAELTFTESDRTLLAAKDVTLVLRLPGAVRHIARYRDRQGWTFPCTRTDDGDFTYVFTRHARPRGHREYNYKSIAELHRDGWTDADLRGEWPGASVFPAFAVPRFPHYCRMRAGSTNSPVGIRGWI